MRSGAVDREPGRRSPRLVPQADGYADYVDPARESSRREGHGQRRSVSHHASGHGRNDSAGSFRVKAAPSSAARPGRQRPVRTTIVWLLVLPLVTMIGLYIYAASGTIGPAEAKQDSATINADVGETDAALSQAIETEEADTFVYQASGHKAIPDSKLTAPGTGDYAKTDAAITAFEKGAAKARGALSTMAETVLPSVYAHLDERAKLRAEVQDGSLNGLGIFMDYLNLEKPYLAFSSTLANANQTIQLFDESQGLIDAGDGAQDVASIGILLGGVLAGGDFMTPQEYQLFEQLYNNQQLEFSTVDNPVFWQLSGNPFWTSVDGHQAAMTSPAMKAVQALEQEVLADGSSRSTVRLPVTPEQVEGAVEAALSPTGPLQTAEGIGRVGITAGDSHQGDVIEERLAGVGLGGLLAVILSAFLLLRFGTRISRELAGLRNAARALSGERLPSVVRRLRAGDDVDVEAEAPPLDLSTRTREVTETADAFSAVQHTAIEAAVEQATLRKGVSNVFRSLARRNQSLVQRQLRMLDEMERGTQDPDALAQLFRLDHLTTRMRRQAEGLIILSGSAPSRRWRQPVAVVEVLRGAISEIEEYLRVDLVADSPDYLTGTAVADVTHLLAELIENAVVYSPPATRVVVRGGRVANGYVIEVEDRGLGIPPAARDSLNERLAQPPDFDLTDSDQLGLFVVSRLAIRNGIKVSLRESGFGGTTAIVLLPSTLVVTEEEAKVLASQGAPEGGARSGSIGQRPTEEDRAVLASRRAPHLDRPARAAHDGHDMGHGFGTSTSAGGPHGIAPAGASRHGASAPRGAGSLGSGPMPTRGESAGRLGGATLPSRGESGRGAFGNPAPFQESPAASPFDSAGDGGGQSEGTGPAGLPKRQKMASLAPQLRENRPQELTGSMPGRSPEQARALLSSIQRGLRTGRDSGAESIPGNGSQAGYGDQGDTGYPGGPDDRNAR